MARNTASTPAFPQGIPFPEGSDRMMDFPALAKQVADMVDTHTHADLNSRFAAMEASILSIRGTLETVKALKVAKPHKTTVTQQKDFGFELPGVNPAETIIAVIHPTDRMFVSYNPTVARYVAYRVAATAEVSKPAITVPDGTFAVVYFTMEPIGSQAGTPANP